MVPKNRFEISLLQVIFVNPSEKVLDEVRAQTSSFVHKSLEK